MIVRNVLHNLLTTAKFSGGIGLVNGLMSFSAKSKAISSCTNTILEKTSPFTDAEKNIIDRTFTRIFPQVQNQTFEMPCDPKDLPFPIPYFLDSSNSTVQQVMKEEGAPTGWWEWLTTTNPSKTILRKLTPLTPEETTIFENAQQFVGDSGNAPDIQMQCEFEAEKKMPHEDLKMRIIYSVGLLIIGYAGHWVLSKYHQSERSKKVKAHAILKGPRPLTPLEGKLANRKKMLIEELQKTAPQQA